MKIGLTQRILDYNKIAYDCLEHGWYTLLSGHTLLNIANQPEQDFAELVSTLDLIIFTGGDASPKRFLTEVRLLTECYKQNKPVIGVCHGAFFINELEEGINRRCEQHYNTTHDVMLDGVVQTVNSYHSNQIAQVGASFEATAHAEDGSIEAFKHKTKPIWGIVWHPERMQIPVLPQDVKQILQIK